MMYFYHLLVVCVLRVAFVSASYVPSIGVGDCLGCGAGDPQNAELEDFLKTQKIAQRLQSIKQQLDNSLRIQRQAKNAPKLKALPQFLVDELMDSNNDAEEERKKDTTEMKQVVLFPEEETSNCHPINKSSVCLKFKLTDDILMANISSAKLWFSKEQFSYSKSIEQNFTIIESTSNTPNSNKLLNTSRIIENDGWYQMEITSTIKSWTNDGFNAQKTLSILCNTCDYMVNPRKRVSKNKTNSPFLLLNTETKKSSRSKRGVDCISGHNACCRENLEVNLAQIEGFEMVYTPTKFNAYVCKGNCYIHSAVNSGKPYATLMSKLKLNDEKEKSPMSTSCCTPNRFSDLPIVYATSDIALQKITIPNMVVESCGCI